jgi:hypothetical protein
MLQSLIDQKKEYIEQLQNLLAVPLAERIYSMYIDSQKKGLKHFQHELNEIPKWNNHVIEEETKQIIKRTKCNYLAKLLKLTILVSVKIKFYEYRSQLKHIDIKIPNLQDFLHKCFINVSEFSWKYSYLFVQHNLKSIEIQNNLNIIEHNFRKMVAKSIAECIHVQEIIELLDEIMERAMKKKKKSKVKEPESDESNSESSKGGSESDITEDEEQKEPAQTEQDNHDDDEKEDDEECDEDVDKGVEGVEVVEDDEEDEEDDGGDEDDVEQDDKDSGDEEDEEKKEGGESEHSENNESEQHSQESDNTDQDDQEDDKISDSGVDSNSQSDNNSNNNNENDNESDDESESDVSIEEYNSMQSSDSKSDVKIVNIIEPEVKPIKRSKRPSFF